MSYNKLLILSVTSLLISSAPLLAKQGTETGGGGQSIVCRNNDGTISSAQLLDLAEAENYYLLDLENYPENKPYLDIAHDYAALLDDSITLINPTAQSNDLENGKVTQTSYDINLGLIMSKKSSYRNIDSLVNIIDKNKKIINNNIFKIPNSKDAHPKIETSNTSCQIEQVAFYKDGDNQVHIVGSIWNQFSNIDKAALLIHEALYRNLRAMGDTNSDRARKTVALLFSGSKFESVLTDLPEEYLFCWTNDSEASFQFAVYPYSNNLVTAQFMVFNGESMLTKTSTRLSIAPFAKQFGKSVDVHANSSVINSVKNPLLEQPTYNFKIIKNHVNDELQASIEAVSLMAGKNLQTISCKKELTTITYGDNGSITMGSTK